MATLNPRRFAQPDTLKTIRTERLLEFLVPFQVYLASHGMGMPADPADKIDYELLSAILMNPDENVPEEMVDALFFVHEMATADAMDGLLEAARESGLELDRDPNSSPADVAVEMWLKDRSLLERKHAEALVLRAKSFVYFCGRKGVPQDLPNPSRSEVETIQTHFDDWFDDHKRGRGSKVFVFANADEGKAWILVRHGMPMKREGAMKDGESSSIFYRPEVHDVLVYDGTLNEIGIHAGTKGERDLYREAFGLHLFGDADYFPDGDKFTLDPLKADGAESLVCSDIEGLEWVKLREIQRYWGGPQKEIETRRADNFFAALADRNATIPASARLIKAVFTVKFENSKNPRSVTVRPPNIATYTQNEDSPLIEAWLMRRGFAARPESEEDEELDAVVVSA